MRTLIFDTETTGIVNFKTKNLDSQPHPVQLACELLEGKETISLFSVIINPGVPIPAEAYNVHGINDDKAATYGISQRAATGLFINFLQRCDRIVGHNIDFDIIITEAMIHRSGINYDMTLYRKIPRICTMQSTTNLLKLPGKYGYKWPQLIEAYKHFVDPNGFLDAHDALADVRACKEILFTLESKNEKLLSGKL